MPTILSEQLTALIGQLRAHNAADETKLEEIQLTIAKALKQQNFSAIRTQQFAFEQSDLYRPEQIPLEKRNKLLDIAKRVEEGNEMPDSHVFFRSVPLRTANIIGGLTSAANGTRATTVGPLLDLSGRDIFIDVVKIKKLLSLYVQGRALPAMLFSATFIQRIPRPGLPPITTLSRTFTLSPNTIWINARLFDPAATEGFYCGLRIKGGSIVLSELPTVADTRITVMPGVTVTVNLDLEQNTSFPTDTASMFGQDARAATFELPNKFSFSFANNIKKILTVAPAAWKVYGSEDKFSYAGNQGSVFNPFLSCIAISMVSQVGKFKVSECSSPFLTVSSSAPVETSWWAMPTAKIDLAAPPEADGNGMLIVECGKGLNVDWQELQGGVLSLTNPFIIGEPGRIGIVDLFSNGGGIYQAFEGWRDALNPFGTSMEFRLRNNALFMSNVLAQGDEIIYGATDCEVKTDRPVKVNGEAVAVKSKNSLFSIWVNKARRMVSVGDIDMLWDNKLPADKIPRVKPFALALNNALFTVTPPNSVLLFASVSEDLKVMLEGKMFLGFGLYSYLPTLPDPYAANIGILKSQFNSRNIQGNVVLPDSTVWLWLIAKVQWDLPAPTDNNVTVSFHFAPLQQQLSIQKDTDQQTVPGTAGRPLANVPSTGRVGMFSNMKDNRVVQDKGLTTGFRASPVGAIVTAAAGNQLHDFALLDVSSNANQMGVAFSQQTNFLQRLVAAKYKIDTQGDNSAAIFPILVQGMEVVTEGRLAQAFTVPQIAWEPVFNLTKPALGISDPPLGFNYYSTDGFATRLGNLAEAKVPLSPIPMAKFLVGSYEQKQDGKTYAMFNLPFGMFAIAMLDNNSPVQSRKATISNVAPAFKNNINGGIQLELTAGVSWGVPGEGDLFDGYTAQLINVNNADGSSANASTLGQTVTEIYNNEFLVGSGLPARPAVPLNRIGISGYGASAFSNWQNKEAVFAQTSQALFNVTTGRTSHEVVQVKSMVYPWGIRVVRTVTLFRMANGFVMRVDSGWKAESDGKFDFTWKKPITDVNGKVIGMDPQPDPYEIYPGLNHGLYNIQNIQEIPKQFSYGEAKLQAITFDADVKLENVVEGGNNDRVPSKGVLGYVQISPAGKPISAAEFKELLAYEQNTIGGSISCMVSVAGTKQRMAVNRFDVNNSVNAALGIAFVAAARGSVVLPKDGSWSLVQHTRGTGEVAPLPEHLSVPLIRLGKWVKDKVVPDNAKDELLRIAYPGDLLKAPDAATLNFGFLQNLNSQKVLFLTPSFKNGIQSLLSKTPPLMADAYRLLNGKGIFPNIGDAETGFGSAMQMLKGVGANEVPIGDVFKAVGGVNDLGKQVLEIMSIDAKEEAGKLIDQGYKLIKDKANNALNDIIKFDLPSFEYPLVDIPKKLKIYIEYAAKSKKLNKQLTGKLDYNVNSFAGALTDSWKGKMSNMAMVVDLGPFTRLMTIKGNFNAQKGKETDFGGGGEGGLNLPTPEIEFSDAFEPVIQILEILSQLSTGKYGDALKKGLKIAMSNSANIWEYKFEATKDIPIVRFPPEANLYNSPQTPLKLEASMAIGVFFNAALKVTTDPKQLLPTAGAFFKFHGGLQVMCVSVGVGTIYAVGSADVLVKADTSPMISLTVKFGFGAQVGVGLPVIGNVSILFMIAIEIYVDSTEKVSVTAIMLFRGHAELLGGLVGVTITIEARGTIEKPGTPPGGPTPPTTCKASVTFALDISIFLVIDISFTETWEETKQIA